METFIAIWENTWEATWCGGCGWRSTDPSTRLTQNSFKVLDKSCPARKSILKWKKPPCTVWRNKFCCCCWGFLFVLFWGEVWGWSKETKQKDILSSWLRERKDRGGGGGEEILHLRISMPKCFYPQCRLPLIRQMMFPISVNKDHPPPYAGLPWLFYTTTNTVSIRLHWSAITHPTSSSHASPGSTADRRYFGHREDTRTGCAYCTGCFEHIPARMFCFRRHKEREPTLAASHSWRWCCTWWFYQGESNGPPWPYVPANSLVSQPTGWPGLTVGNSGEMGWLQRRIQVK